MANPKLETDPAKETSKQSTKQFRHTSHSYQGSLASVSTLQTFFSVLISLSFSAISFRCSQSFYERNTLRDHRENNERLKLLKDM
jgi:hypothetical protein